MSRVQISGLFFPFPALGSNCSVRKCQGKHLAKEITAGVVFTEERDHIYTTTGMHNTIHHSLVRIMVFFFLETVCRNILVAKVLLLSCFFLCSFKQCFQPQWLHWSAFGRKGWYRMKPEKGYLHCHQMVITLTQYAIGLYWNSNAAFVTKHKPWKAAPGYCDAFQAYILAGLSHPSSAGPV